MHLRQLPLLAVAALGEAGLGDGGWLGGLDTRLGHELRQRCLQFQQALVGGQVSALHHVPDTGQHGSVIPDTGQHDSVISDKGQYGSVVPDTWRCYGSVIPDTGQYSSVIPDTGQYCSDPQSMKMPLLATFITRTEPTAKQPASSRLRLTVRIRDP